VGAVPQALDPDGRSLGDASLGDLRVSALTYFGRFLVVAGSPSSRYSIAIYRVLGSSNHPRSSTNNNGF